MIKILDQWQEWECAFFAVLGCLMRMKEVDVDKIIEEARPDFHKMLSHKSAAKWLKDRGYIKDMVSYRYNPLTLPKIPLIARIYRVDWVNTRKPPYKLTMGQNNKNAHYVCITDKWTCVNSWGEGFGNKWYFYFDDTQLWAFSFISRLII